MPKANGPNYEAIKTAYLKGGPDNSIPKLAARFKVSQSTLEKRASREKWKDQQQETGKEVARILPQKIAEVVASEAAERTREHLRVWGLLLKEAEKRLTMMDPILGDSGEPVLDRFGHPLMLPHVKDTKHLDALANTVKKATEGERLALGMDKTQSNPLDDADFNGGSLWEVTADEPPGDGE